jgi:hypothetical protein
MWSYLNIECPVCHAPRGKLCYGGEEWQRAMGRRGRYNHLPPEPCYKRQHLADVIWHDAVARQHWLDSLGVNKDD